MSNDAMTKFPFKTQVISLKIYSMFHPMDEAKNDENVQIKNVDLLLEVILEYGVVYYWCLS